jgi:ABC-type antimicrobial peptide transport system permease subunit
VENSTAIDRLFAGLCSGLAVVALLLACIGLYGLMAYQVARRTTEIGVRMALGATRREIAWPIVQEALRLATVGLGIGLPVALVLTQAIKKQLYGVPPYDPATLGAGAMVLLTIAALAAWLPARRAAAVDPMTALRAE